MRFLRLLFLPFFEVYFSVKRSGSIVEKLTNGVLTAISSSLTWSFVVLIIFLVSIRVKPDLVWQTGFLPVAIEVSGTGSMYPTFPKGNGETEEERMQEVVAAPKMYAFPGGMHLGNKLYFHRTLSYGDIVSFQSARTEALLNQHAPEHGKVSGFVKRVIGLPGDVIELRDGFVYRNREKLVEPYIATARSTFGGETVPECSLVQVPEQSVFVLGDNRKASDDSRFQLGWVNLQDIDYILPWNEQQPYTTLWRDASQDSNQEGQAQLNTDEFVQKVNELRQTAGQDPLKRSTKLDQSSQQRAEAILQYDDLSFEATRSGVSVRRAMQEQGYRNIVIGEAPVLGYYTADELLEYFQTQGRWKSFFTNPEYQDIGVASFVGMLHSCPTQILVVHVGGYKPPDYSTEYIQSWKKAANSIAEVLPSWEKARTFGSVYEENKVAFERMIAILRERQEIVTKILNRIQAQQWLTAEDEALIKKEQVLGQEQTPLANDLNLKLSRGN